MNRRLMLGVFLLSLFALPGCNIFRRGPSGPNEIPEVITPQFHRPGSSGKTYSLNPRMQAVERNLGLR